MVREKTSLVLKASKLSQRLWVVFTSIFTFFTLIFPSVSFASPVTHTQTISSPSRLWLMSPEDDERCRQDTERYNAAWTAAWYASHPGQGPAPTPTPPYVCPPPPPDTPTTPTNPTPVTPNKPIVPGTTQGTGLPNELENKPGNTPELNTGLGKPGEYKPGYDPATGLPVNGAEQASPNTGDPNDPQTGELARWAAANNTSPPQVNNGKPIVPANVGPGEPVHQPGEPIVPANVGPDAPKPPAPKKPEIVPDKPVDSGSLNPVQKQPVEKVTPKPKPNNSDPVKELQKRLPCIATWGLPVLGGLFGTGTPGINGAETGDLGYLVRLNGQMYAILGDTFKLTPPAPGSYNLPKEVQKPVKDALNILGQTYRGANTLVPVNPDGTFNQDLWNKMQGRVKQNGLRSQGQPSRYDKVLRKLSKGASRLLPGGVIDTGNKNSALVMVTPVKGLTAATGRGALYEVHLGKNGMPVWTPYNVDLPKGVSQISGATQISNGVKGSTYFSTNSIDRSKGMTMWRAKNMRDKNTWEWQDSKGKWHSYKNNPNFAQTFPDKNTGEMDLKQLKDGSWAMTYTDNKNGRLLMRQAKTPGELRNAPVKDITPLGARSVYDANIMNPRQTVPDDMHLIFSRWNEINYNINKMNVTGNCKK